MSKIISLLSFKGGVTKTTTGIYLSLNLVNQGYRVLLIDGDNNNCATHFSCITTIKENDRRVQVQKRQEASRLLSSKSIRKLITYEVRDPQDLIVPTAFGYDLIPSAMDLKGLSVEMASDGASFDRFRTVLRGLDYDYIVLDCAPGTEAYQFRLFAHASDLIISPFSLFEWDSMGYKPVYDDVMDVSKKARREIQVKGLLSKLDATQMEIAESFNDDSLFKARIPKNADVEDYIERSEVFGKRSKFWKCYEELAREVA